MNRNKLDKLQKIELEILQEVARICNENKIDYFLIGGTLLGAVRHKGFIPWDDDLDIVIPRKDYEKFLKLCQTQLNSKYFLHCNQTDSNYWLPFAKIRKNKTTFNEQAIANIETHKGIFIDIFPLDNANKQRSIIQDIQAFFTKKLTYIIMQKRGIKVAEPHFKMRLMLRILQPISIQILSKLQQKIMSFNSNNNSKYFVNLGSQFNHIKQTIPKGKYYPGVKVEFECMSYNAPKEWHYILKRLYGDYMQLPPENKRINHNPVQIYFKDSVE